MATKKRHRLSDLDVPPDIFKVPTQEELDLNRGFWDGYAASQLVVATGVLPSPAGSRDYDTYRIWFEAFFLPTTDQGSVNNFAVGYNSAIADAANWLWRNDPNSPFKIPPS